MIQVVLSRIQTILFILKFTMNGVPKKTHTKKHNKTKQNKQIKTTTKTNKNTQVLSKSKSIDNV